MSLRWNFGQWEGFAEISKGIKLPYHPIFRADPDYWPPEASLTIVNLCLYPPVIAFFNFTSGISACWCWETLSAAHSFYSGKCG